jgi:hypothetical protein
MRPFMRACQVRPTLLLVPGAADWPTCRSRWPVSSRKKVDTDGYLWLTVLSVTRQVDGLLSEVSGAS